jgi:hypothetical protein
MSREELSELYKLTLHLSSTQQSGIAGLGLIDIARDSSEQLQYFFSPIDSETSFYSLGVQI